MELQLHLYVKLRIHTFHQDPNTIMEASNSNRLPLSSSFTSDFGMPEEWHHGKLPHRNRKNLIQFITFRLQDSIPNEALKSIEDEIKNFTGTKKEIEKQKNYEKWLDKGLGSCALNNPVMAKVVFNALHYHDGERYDLFAWSIMPNHVHILVRTENDLSKIVQSWKSFTGRWAMSNNKKYNLRIDDNAKKFWMPEYWDTFMRNRAHFDNTVKYILDNPKKARLPKDSTAYKYTGSKLGGIELPGRDVDPDSSE